MKKKIISICLALSMGHVAFALPPAVAPQPVSVKLNGELLTFDTVPQIINNRTMVPMRTIFEAIGATVAWDNGTITASYNDKQMTLTVGSADAKILKDGVENSYTLDSAPVIINDRTLVPVRFVSEQLGLDVEWNAEERTVYLSQHTTVDAIMDVEGYGRIVLELYPEFAPATVENFVNLAKSGFYDGLTFHRIIENFMIQGGDPLGTGYGGSENTIPGEFFANDFSQNIISHTRGVISMARSQDYNSASSQFFIVHKDSTFLDGQYAAFGIVVEGMDVVDKIAAVDTDPYDYPLESVIIKSITISE